MLRIRPKHSTVVAYLALAVALSGTAIAATSVNGAPTGGVPNAGGFYNSGLVKLNNGQSRVIVTRGPFRLTAKCVNDGGGYSTAQLSLKNIGSHNAVLESDYNAEYASPILAPGDSRTAFYPESNNAPYFFGDYYNLFSAAAPGHAITGMGSIGWKTLGADCLFQLVIVGT
ncbi:MAG: hypothetical protein QOE83_90 [Actinomycetota bacterium]|jgi:hypothetical protein|nr:hypothetical protein [Actinomycetota bacterium]